MAETYFKNFNLINYANNVAIDLTERVIVINNLEKNPYLFYPTDITNGARPDQFAAVAYNDSYASWILYLTNGIVDPYYEWYLDDYQFNQFVGSKYGTIEKAQQKVAYYYNNWIDQSTISLAVFDSLSADQQVYWEPTYDNFNRIISYQRKKDDRTVSTNFIVNIVIDIDQSSMNANSFINDEIVTIKYNDQSSGKGQVAYSNASTIVVRHCSGDFFPRQDDDIVITDTSYIYGQESQSNCLIQKCVFIANNIPADQYAYWSSKTYYQVEQEKNEGNKTVNLLQPQYAPQFIRNTKQLSGQ